jgi:hypothetical protein
MEEVIVSIGYSVTLVMTLEDACALRALIKGKRVSYDTNIDPSGGVYKRDEDQFKIDCGPFKMSEPA